MIALGMAFKCENNARIIFEFENNVLAYRRGRNKHGLRTARRKKITSATYTLSSVGPDSVDNAMHLAVKPCNCESIKLNGSGMNKSEGRRSEVQQTAKRPNIWTYPIREDIFFIAPLPIEDQCFNHFLAIRIAYGL